MADRQVTGINPEKTTHPKPMNAAWPAAKRFISAPPISKAGNEGQGMPPILS